MIAVKVYRVDYARKTKSSIGVVLEQRKTERGDNHKDLLRLARKTFALDTEDGIRIVIDASQVRRSYPPAETMDCWAG
jgi:hypothetical protein